jgi:hypothetical protein
MEPRAKWRDEPAETLPPHRPSVAGALDLIASWVQIGQILVDGITFEFSGRLRRSAATKGWASPVDSLVL